MKPNRRSKRAFTLIELLTVIAIIGILAAMLFPAIKASLRKAEVTQAKTDVKAIESAIKSYYTEYGKLPVADADQGLADQYYGTSGKFQYDIIDTLRALSVGGHANNNHVLNPRKIVFLEPPSRKGAIGSSGTINGAFLDPWGQVYYIKLDNDYSGAIDYYSTTTTSNSMLAVIVSYGPNGTQSDPASANSDDVVNYR